MIIIIFFYMTNVKQPNLTAYAEEEFVDQAAEMETCSTLENDKSAKKHVRLYIRLSLYNCY